MRKQSWKKKRHRACCCYRHHRRCCDCCCSRRCCCPLAVTRMWRCELRSQRQERHPKKKRKRRKKERRCCRCARTRRLCAARVRQRRRARESWRRHACVARSGESRARGSSGDGGRERKEERQLHPACLPTPRRVRARLIRAPPPLHLASSAASCAARLAHRANLSGAAHSSSPPPRCCACAHTPQQQQQPHTRTDDSMRTLQHATPGGRR